MIWAAAFTLVERLGFPLVIFTFLSLGVAYHAPAVQDASGLALQVGALGMGAVALWIAYSVVRTALPECELMALATSAALAVLPGHVAALSSNVLLGVAEAAFGMVLLGLVRMARTAVLQRGPAAGGGAWQPPPPALTGAQGSPRAEPGDLWSRGKLLDVGFWTGIVLAAAPGALAALALIPAGLLAVGRMAGLRGRGLLTAAGRGTLMAGAAAVVVAAAVLLAVGWLGAGRILPQGTDSAPAGALELAAALGAGFGAFWLPAGWQLLPHGMPALATLALVSVMGALGAAVYALRVAWGGAGLEEAERAAIGVMYVAAGLALLGALTVVVRGAAPGPGVLYPFLAPLALLGIIGFENWFPPVTRPLVVFGLLVGLFALNLFNLVAVA
ncbi:MAG: hypothetical protein HY689_12795 [Chloroflexi bacterium]|nr:hypothetical protein [Chloroflexota bacterium]